MDSFPGFMQHPANDFDEYFTVVQGCYTLVIEGRRIPIRVGEEHFIPRETPHAGEAEAGTGTIHALGARPRGA